MVKNRPINGASYGDHSGQGDVDDPNPTTCFNLFLLEGLIVAVRPVLTTPLDRRVIRSKVAAGPDIVS